MVDDGDNVDNWEHVLTSAPVNTYLLTNLDRTRAYALKVRDIIPVKYSSIVTPQVHVM
mgnify:FL=1